ncbi:MAG: FAD-binding oxidoreductase, partial [Alphaproteobacteria bacterium]
PSAAEWARLERSVGGHLIEGTPLFSACEADRTSAACADVIANVKNPFFIGDQNGGTELCGWLDAWTPRPSAYVVAARTTGDVVAAVNFARDHNLRLVVKGAGHSYQGTSNAPDSLLVWTRWMNSVTVHDAFVPKGADPENGMPAVSAEAGAVWMDLYDAVTTKAGRYVQGGGCADVGVAGLIQSGGFGVYSKGFGTAAASLLEAEIVTADGKVRVVNTNDDPDLFWAIKGGGGGSWGVVTRLTLRTHDLPPFFGGSWGKIEARSDTAYHKLIARFFDFYQNSLLNPHWGEQVFFGPGNRIELSMACVGLTRHEVKAVWQPFFEWVDAAPQDYRVTTPLGAGVWPSRNQWNLAVNKDIVPDPRPGAPSHHGWWRDDQGEAGAFIYGYDSLWLPKSLLGTSELVDAMLTASRFKMVRCFFNKGLAGAPSDAIAATLKTATNPKVTEAFALAIIADGNERPAYPGQPGAHVDLDSARKDARAIDAAIEPLRKIAPRSGSYVSESNYFNARWQDEFWGANYPRLKVVKAKYDPDGLFFVHHGVGSEEWSPDGFTRLKG